MNGNLEIRDPKRIRSAESPDVSETQAGAQVALAFHANWSGLPEALIPKIGLFLNKQDASRMTCVCRAFNTGITTSSQIKRPLTKIRDDFKQEVGALPSDTEIPAYTYNHVRVLSGHTDTVLSVTQVKDGRIVSASEDKTLRVWGYVDPETGDAS